MYLYIIFSNTFCKNCNFSFDYTILYCKTTSKFLVKFKCKPANFFVFKARIVKFACIYDSTVVLLSE